MDKDCVLSVEDGDSSFFLTNALVYQRKQGKCCDVAFNISGTIIKAHSCVLMTQSTVFESYFSDRNNSQFKLLVPCKNPEAFEACLDYLYLGKITISKTNCVHLLKLANDFKLVRLKEHCCQYIMNNVNLTRACHQLLLADQTTYPVLNNHVSTFIEKNSATILKSQSFKLFQFSSFCVFIKNLNVNAPLLPLNFISHWVGFNFQTRHPHLPSLFDELRWNLSLTKDIAIKHILDDKNYVDKKICLFYLLKHFIKIGFELGEYASWLEEYESMYLTNEPEQAVIVPSKDATIVTVTPSKNSVSIEPETTADQLNESDLNMVVETENKDQIPVSDTPDVSVIESEMAASENTRKLVGSNVWVQNDVGDQSQDTPSSTEPKTIKPLPKKVEHVLTDFEKKLNKELQANTCLIKKLKLTAAKIMPILSKIGFCGERITIQESEKKLPFLFEAYQQNRMLERRIFSAASNMEKIKRDKRFEKLQYQRKLLKAAKRYKRELMPIGNIKSRFNGVAKPRMYANSPKRVSSNDIVIL